MPSSAALPVTLVPAGKRLFKVHLEGAEKAIWAAANPLHGAAVDGSAAGVQEAVAKLTKAVDIDSHDSEGWSPLHYACWHGEVNSASELLKFGAAIGASCTERNSQPLHLAAGMGHADVVALLIGHGQ